MNAKLLLQLFLVVPFFNYSQNAGTNISSPKFSLSFNENLIVC
ncbi:hypothetical protein BH10BAC3_BH10BAC3_35410 [soil metagenome]